ncbi:MAG: hypothetical protein OEY24_04990 [Candidatus Bathyarchaeota archaeon]|nr:hypothetical protein [Candidatus Bathyarchaeota archaeon]MDH5495037.1 hypothetical protein [Candidatus Bathyarchaeota archaeon]
MKRKYLILILVGICAFALFAVFVANIQADQNFKAEYGTLHPPSLGVKPRGMGDIPVNGIPCSPHP